jgi:hypothetical protein
LRKILTKDEGNRRSSQTKSAQNPTKVFFSFNGILADGRLKFLKYLVDILVLMRTKGAHTKWRENGGENGRNDEGQNTSCFDGLFWWRKWRQKNVLQIEKICLEGIQTNNRPIYEEKIY